MIIAKIAKSNKEKGLFDEETKYFANEKAVEKYAKEHGFLHGSVDAQFLYTDIVTEFPFAAFIDPEYLEEPYSLVMGLTDITNHIIS